MVMLKSKPISIPVNTTYQGHLPLVTAISNGHTRIVIHNGAQVNLQDSDKSFALLCASIEGYTELVKLLLDKCDVQVDLQNGYKNSALIAASKEGYMNIVDHHAQLDLYRI